MPKVNIQNLARTIEIPLNANLRTALKEAKVPLYDGAWKLFNCHGRGRCASCEILVLEGADALTPRTPAEHSRLKTYDTSRRLACQCAILGDQEITINTEAI